MSQSTGDAFLDAGDTRPMLDAALTQSRLREAHPEVFAALDLPKERQDALHSNVPSCIEAVSLPGFLHPALTCATALEDLPST